MKKIFSILAMVAALALVGCEKEGGDVNQPLTLEGAQWAIVGEEHSIVGIGVCRAGYDIGLTEKGRMLSFMIVDEPSEGSQYSKGDALSLAVSDYTAEYDEEGNMIRLAMIFEGEVLDVADITMIDRNNAIMVQSGGDISITLQRIETPFTPTERGEIFQ